MWRISNDRIDRLVVFAEVTGSPTPIGEMVFDGTQKRISYFRYAASWLERINPPLLFPTALPRRRKATPSASIGVKKGV